MFLCLPILAISLCLFLCTIYLLLLPVLIGCPYIVVVLWDPEAQSPWSPHLVALGILFSWVIWALLLQSNLYYCLGVHVCDQPSGWMTVRIDPNHIYKLLCRCWPYEAEFALAESGVYQDLPLDMLFVKLLGSSSDAWIWPLDVLILGPLGRNCSKCQCQILAVTLVFGATERPTVYGCLCLGWVCVGRTSCAPHNSFKPLLF